MKEHIHALLHEALQATAEKLGVRLGRPADIQVMPTRDSRHGDFASNVALVNARAFQLAPRQLAEQISKALAPHALIEKIAIAGPGFINFYLCTGGLSQIIPKILAAGQRFGHSDFGQGQRVLVEFVSANPTGPLHIGHGRGAAYGDAVASLLQAAGFAVTREYYVNDAGRQMDILAISIWLKYLARCGCDHPYPEAAYQAAYITDIATALHEKDGKQYLIALDEVINKDWDRLTPELQLDALVSHARARLGTEKFQAILTAGLNHILSTIQADLADFGVRFDRWFSERTLFDSGEITQAIAQLRAVKAIYDQDGASWFAAREYGDEKDRVVKRENGSYTYFAADIAYHANKLQRGFDKIINVWGADHHGYIQRVKAALAALADAPDKLTVLLVQFATLYRDGKNIPMSTRSGQYVTLRELMTEVGVDAARFFYVMRRSEQHLDFDLDLATSQSNDNPVYYIHYAHARICSVLREMQQKNYTYDQQLALDNLHLLTNDHELALISHLSRYEQQIINSAKAYEPHTLCFFLRDLAHCFHSYYNMHKLLIEHTELRQARLALITATRQVLGNGLAILGVSAPEKM